MKKILWGLIFGSLLSCEQNGKVDPPKCYLASIRSSSYSAAFTYDNQNKLISYAAPNIYSSILTYDNSGKIITELDDDVILINYSYNNKNLLVLWALDYADDPSSNLQAKFSYNSAGQDTLQQFYKYDETSTSYELYKFIRLSYSSTNSNYSERKTYNASSVLLYTEDYLWDTHPNPYLANVFFINEPPPTNNIIQYTYTQPGESPQVTVYIYTYNSNGFPLKQIIPGWATVATYTYANCN